MRIFDIFGSRDLDLDPMTFIYEQLLNPYSVEMNQMCEMNYLVKAFES